MLIAKYTVVCDDCDNVPGFNFEFPSAFAAQNDAEDKGWYIGLSRQAFCPYCRKNRGLASSEASNTCQTKHRDGRVCGARSERHRCFPNG
jgi:hypothetical protein